MNKYSKHHYRYYNCFGCPGMLFEGEEGVISERFKQCGLYILLPFVLAILLLIYLLAVPVYMLGSLIANPCVWPSENPYMCEYRLAKCLCCQTDCLGVRILAWFFLQPRSIFYAVFVAPVKITVKMFSYLCESVD